MYIEKWIRKEFIRLRELEDNEESQRRMRQLRDIIEKSNACHDAIFHYEDALRLQNMKNRGILLEKSKYSADILKNNWINSFIPDLTESTKKKIFFDQYLWHALSYKEREALDKSKARQAFNRKNKKQVYIFYQHNDNAYYIDNAQNLKSSDFDKEQDIYIMDANLQWTYIHTHEIQCGPYFVQNKSDKEMNPLKGLVQY